jgi:hypothetical protein
MCPSNGSEVFEALACGKALLSLDVVPAGRPFDIPPHLHAITSNLAKLSFHVEWDIREHNAMKAFFDNTTLPSLHTLELRDMPPHRDRQAPPSDIRWPVEAFRSLIQRSECGLKRLVIVRAPMSDRTLISILECVSGMVEQLIVKEPTKKCSPNRGNEPLYGLSSITDRLVERLHVGVSTTALRAPLAEQDRIQDSSTSDLDSPSGGDTLLPALRHLELSCKGKPSELNLVKFVKMIQSRCPRGPEARVVAAGTVSDAAALMKL